VLFVNDEMFVECRRPDMGAADRELEHGGTLVKIEPRPLSDYHLGYDANWLPRKHYLSDSGGVWSQPVLGVEQGFGTGQLHMLVHPDWWAGAFERVAA
jgi:hypothetical protein